ncbi:MAG: hypothetical protein F4114_11230 [Rhodospirillaceae bacterium]|nr:hypothetical protein [Rhodospirillaceae bacterium]MDE0703813.1 hypothetical protein [Rhodospirillaceae bacterium]MXW92743.1 hypothetical protein [Rhodospirillaceae bacterium]MYB14417.1 hypothetical protein [Rhodospirillaceae bacterium]MYI49644.1 hypothetical protein [Rhodospirillaceae bacterium]
MSSHSIDQSNLTKGQVRKLNALCKSVGHEIGERAFVEWLSSQTEEEGDSGAETIANTLWPLVQDGSLKIPRGGYRVRRGRGRIIVEPAGS